MFPLRFDPETIDRPHLLTIRYSHYCELARWALDHAGAPYTEVAYAVGCHMEPIGSLRVDLDARSEGSFPGAETVKYAERRQHGVPLVCMPGGGLLRDSWEVLEHFVAPVAAPWKARLDEEVGPAARRFAYRALLDPERPELAETMAQGITEQERAFWEQAKPVVVATVSDLMGLSAEREVADRALLVAFFDEVSAELAALPSPGDGAAGAAWWIACSSLAGLALLPPGYAGGAWDCPPLVAFGPEREGWVRGLRSTALGAAILDYYASSRARSS